MKVAFFSSKDYDKKFMTAANNALAPAHRYVKSKEHGSAATFPRLYAFPAYQYPYMILVRVRHTLTYFDAHLEEKTASLAAGHQVVCCFVNDEVNSAVVDQFLELGVDLIALRSAGCNNVDLEYVAKCGLSVVHVPAYSPQSVAEHALALLLTLNRKTHKVSEGTYLNHRFKLRIYRDTNVRFNAREGVQPRAGRKFLLGGDVARLLACRENSWHPWYGKDRRQFCPHHGWPWLSRAGIRRDGEPCTSRFAKERQQHRRLG